MPPAQTLAAATCRAFARDEHRPGLSPAAWPAIPGDEDQRDTRPPRASGPGAAASCSARCAPRPVGQRGEDQEGRGAERPGRRAARLRQAAAGEHDPAASSPVSEAPSTTSAARTRNAAAAGASAPAAPTRSRRAGSHASSTKATVPLATAVAANATAAGDVLRGHSRAGVRTRGSRGRELADPLGRHERRDLEPRVQLPRRGRGEVSRRCRR